MDYGGVGVATHRRKDAPEKARDGGEVGAIAFQGANHFSTPSYVLEILGQLARLVLVIDRAKLDEQF